MKKIKSLLFLFSCLILVVTGVVALSPSSTFAQAGNTYWNVERDGSNNLNFYFTNFGTNSPTALQINQLGNVGIGTTAPGAYLDIKGNNINNVGQLRLQAQDYGQISFYNSNNPAATAANRLGDIYYDVSGTNFVFENQAGNKNILLNPYTTGKVGINTTAPQRSLDLGTNGQMTFGNNGYSSTGSPGIFWYVDNTNYGIYKTAGAWSGNYQQLMLNWSTGLILDGGSGYGRSGTTLQPNGGNVGVGINAGVGGATATTHGKLDVYNSGANGDGAVFAPDINLDNNFTIQTYIDETANPPASGWAGRKTYAGACCNNLALQPDVGTVSIGGVSGNYGGSKLNVVGAMTLDNVSGTTSYFRGPTQAFNNIWYDENDTTYFVDPSSGTRLKGLEILGATNWAPVVIQNNLNTCNQWSWACPVRMMEFYAFNTWLGEIYSNSAGTVYGNGSDYRLKENIRPVNIESALETVMQIPVRQFSYKNRPNSDSMGYIAHELQPFAPYAVAGNKDQVDENGKPVYQAVDYGRITPLLTASVQELNHKLDLLKADNDELKEQNQLLKELICKDNPQSELCK